MSLFLENQDGTQSSRVDAKQAQDGAWLNGQGDVVVGYDVAETARQAGDAQGG